MSAVDLDRFYSDLMYTEAGMAVASHAHYLSAELPQSAGEFIHLLAQLGYLVGECEDLRLKYASAHRVAPYGLEGHGLDSAAVPEGVRADVVLDVHLTSSCDARAADSAGDDVTVEGPADNPAGLEAAVQVALLAQHGRPSGGTR